MNIDNGRLHFEAELDNEKLKSAIDEIINRIQGLSKESAESGVKLDNSFKQAADDISKTFAAIDQASDIHRAKIDALQQQYEESVTKGAKAFQRGADAEYQAQRRKQAAIQTEISARKQVINELEVQAEELTKSEQNFKKLENAQKAVNDTQISMRSRIKELKEEMMRLREQGVSETSAAFNKLKDELGRLTDIQGDVATQAKILSNDNAGFQGVLSGLQGVSGAFTAATGAVSLFAGENENLQKIMLRVQSLMSITIGLQQVSEALNKDSAFSLVTLRKAKEWWNNVLTKSGIIQEAETAATVENTVAENSNTAAVRSNTLATQQNARATSGQATAQAVETAAAKAGTVANFTLAGAFRAVGVAIKSIPVFGWIAAGIGALIAVISHFSKKSKEAAEQQKKQLEELKAKNKEYTDSIADNAVKPLMTLQRLKTEYNKLADNLKAKEKFIKDNEKAFSELGFSVTSVKDAENIFIKNTDKAVQAIMARARAAAAAKLQEEATLEELKKQIELDDWKNNGKAVPTQYKLQKSGKYAQSVSGNGQVEQWEKVEDVDAINKAREKKEKELQKSLDKAKQESAKYTKYVQKYTEEEKKALKDAGIELSKQSDKNAKTSNTATEKFKEALNQRKAAYQEYYKYINSGDDTLVQYAKDNFKSLIEQGATYTEYLKAQRDKILAIDEASRTATDRQNLNAIMQELADLTNKSVLNAFNESLQSSLNGATSLLEKIQIIQKKREDVSKESEELAAQENEALDKAQKDVIQQSKDNYLNSLKNYTDYLNSRLSADEKYYNKVQELEKALSVATSDTERKILEQQLLQADTENNLRIKQNIDDLLKQYRTYQQQIDDIDKEYKQKRATLRQALDSGEISTENYTELMKMLVDDYKKAVKDINNEAAESVKKNSQLLISLFEDSSKKSVSSIKKILEQTELLVDYLKGNSDNLSALQEIGFTQDQLEKLKEDPEAIKEIVKAYDELQQKLKDKSPFTAISQGFKTLIKSFKQGSDQAKSTDDTTTKAMTDIANGVADIANQTSGVFKNFAEAFRNASDECQDFADILDTVGQTLDIVGGMASGTAKLVAGDYLGGAVDILNSTAQIVSNIFSSNARAAAARKEIMNSLIAQQREYNLALLQANLEYERANTIFGNDNYGKAKNAVDNLKESYQQLKDAMAGTDEQKQAAKAYNTIAEFFGSEKRMDEAYAGLSTLQVQTGWKKTGLFGWGKGKATYDNLLDIYPELIDADGKFNKQLAESILNNAKLANDEQKAILQNLIDLQDQCDAAAESLNDYLSGIFGSLADEITDSIVNAFISGTDAAEDFTKSVSKMLESLGKDMLKSLYIMPLMEKYQEQLKAVINSGESEEDIFTSFANIFSNMTSEINETMPQMQDFIQALKEAANGNGFDIYGDEDNDNPQTAAVKTITTEQAGIISGQMNAIRIQQFDTNQILDTALVQLSIISRNSEYLTYLRQLDRIVSYLEGNSRQFTLSDTVGNQLIRAHGLRPLI